MNSAEQIDTSEIAQQLWSNEAISARCNLQNALSNLEQMQALGRTLPATESYTAPTDQAIACTQAALANIRFDAGALAPLPAPQPDQLNEGAD